MNRSAVRRLVESTKNRIKATSNPRDLVLKEAEYQKLLRLVQQLDHLLSVLSRSETSQDAELIASIIDHRQSLAPVLHVLVSDSARANREGRAVNRWSYKKKLHVVSKSLVDGVQVDLTRLSEVHGRINAGSSSASVCQRTVAAPRSDYSDYSDSSSTLVSDSPSSIELETLPHHAEPIAISSSTSSPNSLTTTINQPGSPRGCILILSMVAAFTLFSCISGLYFTLNKSLGYSMGDAFTLAAYIVAVGALVSTAALARYWPSCRCWRGDLKQAVGGDDGEGVGW
ncbi:hypothetical protein EG329_010651 [Mollisiaceae sp. DMI_Dod_QoI]|nr:hypothetical protein EG329_010651 [Helotiales sp. DMI_Dod_QoI]